MLGHSENSKRYLPIRQSPWGLRSKLFLHITPLRAVRDADSARRRIAPVKQILSVENASFLSMQISTLLEISARLDNLAICQIAGFRSMSPSWRKDLLPWAANPSYPQAPAFKRGLLTEPSSQPIPENDCYNCNEYGSCSGDCLDGINDEEPGAE